MKVFHGPQNIGGMAGLLARGQRAQGCDARAVCWSSGVYGYGADEILERGARPGHVWARLRAVLGERPPFTAFQFYFGESLAGPRLWDVPLLRRMGRQVFFYFCGCDIRDNKYTIANYDVSACAHCWPALCSRNRAHARQVAIDHANATFVSTPDLLEFVPGSVLLPQPVDLASIDAVQESPAGRRPPGEPGVDRPVRICHAPTNRALKGTGYLVEAVERLQSRGVPLELVLIERCAHDAALAVCASCDLAVDQLLVGWYGLSSIETMALGLPTICYIRDDLRQHYPGDCPVVAASPATIEEVLAEWVESPHLWSERGAAGAAYARRVHDHVAVAKRMLAFYAGRPEETSCALR